MIKRLLKSKPALKKQLGTDGQIIYTARYSNTIPSRTKDNLEEDINLNTTDTFQILDDYNNTCSETGYGAGTSPCHSYYISVREYNKLVDELVLSKLNIGTSDPSIIGYTHLEPSNETTQAITTSFNVIDTESTITFKAPRTGKVLIEVSFFRDSIASNLEVHLALGDSSGTSLGSSYEKLVSKVDEVDDVIVKHSWLLIKLIEGTEYTYSILSKSNRDGTSIKYGGNYPALSIKASTLPASIKTMP